jgi:hypothetical protein
MVGIPIDLPIGKSLSDVIFPIQPHVQNEYYQYQQQLLNDAQLITGNGPNQLGTFAPGRRTKYETQVVEERNVIRTSSRRDNVGQTIANTMTIVNRLITKYWKAPMVQKVVGMDAAVYWVKATPSDFADIENSMITTVNVESIAPTSRERRKQEALEVMDVLSRFQGNGQNLIPILQQFLSMFDWVKASNLLPVASPTIMPMNEFTAQQNQLANTQNIGTMAGNNLAGMSSMVNSLPSQPQQQMMEGQDD